MEASTIIALIISAGSLLIVLIFNLLSTRSRRDAYNSNRVEEITTIKTDIRYIRDNFDDLRLDIREIKRDQNNLTERMAKAETNIETLYKRTKKVKEE